VSGGLVLDGHAIERSNSGRVHLRRGYPRLTTQDNRFSLMLIQKWWFVCTWSGQMNVYRLLFLPFCFVFFTAPDHLKASCVADNYTLWLSATSAGVQGKQGNLVSMQFPAPRHMTSPDGCRAKYSSVFPKIDLVVYENSRHFEYDWRIAPGADPSAIRVSFRGARSQRIAPDGALILSTSGGEVRHGRPFAYQDVSGARYSVTAAFEFDEDGQVQFKLGKYDKSKPLVIDPELSFVSGIGGSGGDEGMFHSIPYTDLASGIALDGSGNIYIAGLAPSPDFPLVKPLAVSASQGLFGSCVPSFLAKLTPDGKTILYSTLLTGCSSSAPSMAVDTSGNVYVVGEVEGGDPLVQVGGGTTTPSTNSAFVAKLDTNGTLKASVAFGGSARSAATSITLGPDDELYVTGTTSSSDFPVTAGVLGSTLSSAQDVFLMKLAPGLIAGNQLPSNAVLYSTYLGPASSPVIASDAAGNAYVAASTTSTAWTATPGVFQSQCWDASREGCADLIALKVNSAGSQFIYTTYLGGSETETIGGLAVDSSGNAYIAGTTTSFDFPTTTGAYDAGFFSQTGFVVKLSPDANHLIYGTLLGEGPTTGTAIAIDSGGNAWVGGWTEDASLLSSSQIQNGIQQTLYNAVCPDYLDPSSPTPDGEAYCPQAGYLAEVSPSGNALVWATYLGSGNAELNGMTEFPYLQPVLNSIVLDPAGNLLVAGNQLAVTNAGAFPSKNNSASVVKISLSGISLSNVSVANAAGFQPGLPAPGGLAALFVAGIPPTGTVVAPGLPLPTELAGVMVLVDGVAAPILAVANASNPGSTQVNFQVPFEVNNGGPQSHIVEVEYAGLSAFIVPQQTGPGIFTGPNGGVIQHASDYSLVTLQNPVKSGEILIIYASGLGAVSSPIASGVGATGADPIGSDACNQVTTNAGTVLYAGLTPGFPGLYQVNVQVSQYLPPGLTYIALASPECWPLQSTFEGNAVAIEIAN
jgi:uncharacterized protein (TIGR03437 family)